MLVTLREQRVKCLRNCSAYFRENVSLLIKKEVKSSSLPLS